MADILLSPQEILKSIPAPTSGPFQPTWGSLKNYKIPKWYTDSKLGIFIHWGAYSVPAFGNEWYPRNMYIQNSPEYKFHLENYGSHKEFGYKDFIPMFTAENWDPDNWAKLFKQSGAKYVILVAEHHDGYALWDSSYTRWNTAKVGPKRDIVRELAQAVRNQGLVFGVSYHRAEHWWYFEPGTQLDSDVNDPKYADLYGPAKKASLNPLDPPSPENQPPDNEFLIDWLLRVVELVEKYRPQVIYFDWWIENPVFQPYLKAFATYYYNRAYQWGIEVVITYKHKAFPQGTAVYDVERGTTTDIMPEPWQADTSVCYNSWGYIRNCEYKPIKIIISHLVDVVSKNGNLLLNIGPKPDGTIPEQQEKLLKNIGDWLEVNGEAIYYSRPWKTYGEGPSKIMGKEFMEQKISLTSRDIRFTKRYTYPYGEILYAIIFGEPKETIVIKSLSTTSKLFSGEIEYIELPSIQKTLRWMRNEEGLIVQLPKQKEGKQAYTLKIVIRKG